MRTADARVQEGNFVHVAGSAVNSTKTRALFPQALSFFVFLFDCSILNK